MISILLTATLAAATPHPLTVDDMLAMERVSDPRVSPDGRLVVFTLRATDIEANRGRTDLWLASTDGATLRRLTSHPENDSDARFLGDGRTIVFLSARSGSQQVWRLSLDGGEAEQLTDLPIDVNAFVPFADDKRLVLAMDVYLDATPAETAKRDAEQSKSKSKAMVFDELLFRHWDSYEDGKRSHLFVWSKDAAAIDLMKGMAVDSPVHPFGGAEQIAISPDGKSVVFAAKSVGREAAWSTNVDLFRVPVDGSAA